ncbi:MAG TPA: DUF4956 domain-containing protein [Gemmatimonadaceae bacterium]|nr:DUF4956 domain-containing protein [Gemmatimonadaceae bacterium]
MPPSTSRSTAPTSARVLARVVVFYAFIFGVGAVAWRYLPRTHLITTDSLDALFGDATGTIRGSGKNAVSVATDQGTLAVTVILAMLGSALLALPVAWIYTLTRARRGYQQSIVQLLIVLPTVIAGVIVLVKYSIALAFGLGSVVAAVRFRNSLDDSKDAVYVFLVTGLGIAAAVDMPVAMVISVLFNAVVVILWMTDFGRTPVALDGRLAERRLERARQLARTGTFVARIDDEVLRNMTAEQLEGVAKRAWRRARENHPDGHGKGGDEEVRTETRLRLRTRDSGLTRPLVEARLEDTTKRWKLGGVSMEPDGTCVLEYVVQTRKRTTPDELLALVVATGGPELVDAELAR